MKKETRTAYLPDGTTATRTTDHAYQYAVAWRGVDGRCGASSWHHDYPAAAKRAQHLAKLYKGDEFIVVPTDLKNPGEMEAYRARMQKRNLEALKPVLDLQIEGARNREERDEHLSDTERAALVQRYRETYPDVTLSADMTEAFVTIIFG